MAFVKNSFQINTSVPVRLSFPNVWEARPAMSQGRPLGEPRFTTELVIDVGEHLPPEVRAANQKFVEDLKTKLKDLVVKSWGSLEAAPRDLRNPLIWGPNLRPAEKDPNIQTSWVIRTASKPDSPPQVGKVILGASGNREFQKFTAENDRAKVYSGAEAYANLGIFSYFINQTNQGLSCALNVLFMTGRHVGRFDGRTDANQVAQSVDIPLAVADEAPAPSASSEPAQQSGDNADWMGGSPSNEPAQQSSDGPDWM